ncbi:IS5 family transposase [Methylomonas sp. ZR1]|nr:IS5 family transposase [Methylomonas sp. ZR1]NOV29421.1 IS5 family transposase [Methylomonas sp. ZR1]NOV30755.1 IS5 family transposase [Methylomonas sp. ZR1]
MPRQLLTDTHWEKLKTIMLSFSIYDKPGLRQTVEGIFYRLRVGCPWRDLPVAFGKWNAVYKRFNAWSLQEKLRGIFQALVIEPDLEWLFIDGSIIKAHQHSSGGAHENPTAIGKSVAGNTTKIHMAVDAGGLPIQFSITGGEVHDCKEAPEFVAKLPQAGYMIADKGYDSEPLRIQIRDQGTVPIIPRKQNSIIGNEEMDWCLYKYRHLVENVFARLKHFRAIATRYDKLKRNFEGAIALACAFIWLPM